ncbi:MAG: hypothetical protein ACI4FY_08525 [Acetatifactor sp.]
MMRASTVKALMWREQFLARKQILINTVLFAAGVLLGLMVLLSFQIGNLKNMDEPEMRGMIEAMVLFYPSISALGYIFALVEGATVKDEGIGWRRFRRTTPIQPICYALVKYLLLLFWFVVGNLLALCYLTVTFLLSGRTLDSSVPAGIATAAIVVLVFTIALQLLTMLFHSLDKAGFTLMAVFFVGWIYFVSTTPVTEGDLPADMVGYLFDKIAGFLPVAAVVGVVTYVAGFLGMTLLLQRREK